MAHRREGWLDHTGLNLIRIVIGSYFFAMAIGLIGGIDYTALLSWLLPDDTANTVSSAILCIVSVMFMSGIFLRTSALAIAALVLSTSLITTAGHWPDTNVDGLWRDVSLAGAVMLCYGSLRRHELRKATVLSVLPVGGVFKHFHRDITPRRVTIEKQRRKTRGMRAQESERPIRPLIAPTHQMLSLSDDQAGNPSPPLSHKPSDKAPIEITDEDVINLFSDI